MKDLKLRRSVEIWTNCNPNTMAELQSTAAITFAFQDAKHDLLTCFSRIEHLEKQLMRRNTLPVITDEIAEQFSEAVLLVVPDKTESGYSWAQEAVDFACLLDGPGGQDESPEMMHGKKS